MKKLPPEILPLFACASLLTLALCVQAGPPKPHRWHAKKGHSVRIHVPNAKERRAAQERKTLLNRKLSGLHRHMRAVKSKIQQAQVKEDQITESLDVVQGRLARTRQEIAATHAHLQRLEERHDALEDRMEETQERLTQRRTLLAARVRENYERGRTSYAQVLLQSRSVHEMLSREYYVKQIVQSDTDLIENVRADIAQIKADTAELEKAAKEQEAIAAQFETQKVQLVADMQREKTLLHGVQVTREQAEDELDAMEDEANAMTSRIRQLSELLRRRQQAARRNPARSHLPGQNNDDEDTPVPAWHGGFRLPVSARITSGFGYRYHPILHRRKLHTGIDFGVSSGTPIHAAGGGTVIMASYSRGYGNCVIIDHGNGTTTLYGHCSSLAVSEGQSVSQGQVIAYSGSTGMSTGPHLHWEVRRNGVPVHP